MKNLDSFPLDFFVNEIYTKGLSTSFPDERSAGHPAPMVIRDESTWDEILSVLPYACIVVDMQGVVLATNASAPALLGLEPDRILHRSLFETMPAWQETSFGNRFLSWARGPASEEPLEYELPVRPGRTLHVKVGSIPGAHDGLPAFILILADATELIRLKQQLKTAEYRASIGKLARGIAHELNNPLDGVLRYTHLALEQAPEETPLREYLVHVKEGLDRMVRAVRSFLEFSRQATTPVRRTSNLNRLIEDSLLLVRHRAKFQQIRIIEQMEEPLPPVLDAGLQYAIVNLIKNAFDAMPHGGTLTLTTRRNHSAVEVEIQDTGPGIPQEVRVHLFEPFFTTKPIHQGNGLGLVIAKEAVERSAGTIEYASQVGEGTTFRIRVPITQDQKDKENPA